jgi:hypothetical protein
VNAEGDPPLSSIDWFYLNSPREGCVLNSVRQAHPLLLLILVLSPSYFIESEGAPTCTSPLEMHPCGSRFGKLAMKAARGLRSP